ncbi:MAG: RpiB/LacA/LacB family sugar-phosphate isomerase [Patescibacteria group bacterium]|nr:RpiB/LacA/LacB family sugar-phosphate isomerase [Patescibacteria group bacterium]
MTIYIASDHRGYNLKEVLKEYLLEKKYEVVDLGNDYYDENDDYPDFAKLVAGEISKSLENKGIVICRSGVGVDIAANKFKGVRSALCFNPEQAYLSRNDDNTNVLALPAGFISDEEAKKITDVWLTTPFSGDEKDKRRVDKLDCGL